MAKVKIGPGTFVCPQPVFLVGANVDNKPNFMTVSWGGVACERPPMISVAIRYKRYTYKGIKQTGHFSVNIPSKDMVIEADYCGIVSGLKSNKVEVCHFKVFYGKLINAPMIEQCPVNLECKLAHILDLGSHALVIGKIEEIHITESCLTNGKPDVAKIEPLIYSKGIADQYQSCGSFIANAFHAGLKLKERE